MTFTLGRLLTSGLGLLALSGVAGAAPLTLDELLVRPAAPPGVVFEIVDRDPHALDVTLPWVKLAAQRLRARFPAVPMALVTHGQEMFALPACESNPAIHQLAQSLSREQGIPVHSCETHAGWRGLAAEDFPAYIAVAPSGPAQIRNYEALDYVRLMGSRAAVLKTR